MHGVVGDHWNGSEVFVVLHELVTSLGFFTFNSLGRYPVYADRSWDSALNEIRIARLIAHLDFCCAAVGSRRIDRSSTVDRLPEMDRSIWGVDGSRVTGSIPTEG